MGQVQGKERAKHKSKTGERPGQWMQMRRVPSAQPGRRGKVGIKSHCYVLRSIGKVATGTHCRGGHRRLCRIQEDGTAAQRQAETWAEGGPEAWKPRRQNQRGSPPSAPLLLTLLQRADKAGRGGGGSLGLFGVGKVLGRAWTPPCLGRCAAQAAGKRQRAVSQSCAHGLATSSFPHWVTWDKGVNPDPSAPQVQNSIRRSCQASTWVQ